ncbi:MAG: DUF4331 family protein [Chitinophagales bacterium]|nr:DUF4331 family protein [Chitinophagales bacterium]
MTYASSKHDCVVASSHREAPLISNDPLADNTDVYAFRSPDDTTSITIIAGYVPLELPQGGPNYYSFGENIAYDIHIKNNPTTTGDDIIYRFKFKQTNEDPTTFFNIRLGKQNLKTTYDCSVSSAGKPFKSIITGGVVPPNNIGPRSIEDPVVGLGTNYEKLFKDAITPSTGRGGEMVYCGPADDPFFVDLGGIFDLAHTRAGGTGVNQPIDAVACHNVHVIAMKIPIKTLQMDHKSSNGARSILDPDYVIGVWASASRPKIAKLREDGTPGYHYQLPYVQVSRLGMPLTNEAIIPIGDKDYWNSQTPYNDGDFEKYFTNPELALYMDDDQFGPLVPAFDALRVQESSQTVLGTVDFTDYADGLFVLYGDPATLGTALDPALYGDYLLRKNQPRSVDILPIFNTGVPNLAPYQLATGKPSGNPLAPGKPFVNNFLPTFGDMLRLNMAVPITKRNSPDFSTEGLLQAAVLGLTDPRYNTNTDLQNIPNMDGFPNGRRLEDDVTRIELQAVSGIVLAAIGLGYDDFNIGESLVTPDLLGVLGYTTGVEKNDTTLRSSFPYVQVPWSGFGKCSGPNGIYMSGGRDAGVLEIGSPELVAMSYPNPFSSYTNFKYHLSGDARVTIRVVDLTGKTVSIVEDGYKKAGNYLTTWNTVNNLPEGIYIATIAYNGITMSTMKINHVK